MELVLSLFPGVDLLGRGFEEEGFSVVRGPDTLLDSYIEDFHVPPGRFDGIIGGPPCQNYSDANRSRNPEEGDRLVLEFLRIIDEARPLWFLMENVRNVPDVSLVGYHVQRLDITDAACGGKQKRLRHIQFGSRAGHIIRPVRTSGGRPVTPAVLTRPTSKHERHCRRLDRQGAPKLPLRSLTPAARSRVIGNGVPFKVARTLARAVTERGPVTDQDCICLCGRTLSARSQRASHATPSCRKRMQRRRDGEIRTLTFVRSLDSCIPAGFEPAAGGKLKTKSLAQSRWVIKVCVVNGENYTYPVNGSREHALSMAVGFEKFQHVKSTEVLSAAGHVTDDEAAAASTEASRRASR